MIELLLQHVRREAGLPAASTRNLPTSLRVFLRRAVGLCIAGLCSLAAVVTYESARTGNLFMYCAVLLVSIGVVLAIDFRVHLREVATRKREVQERLNSFEFHHEAERVELNSQRDFLILLRRHQDLVIAE